MSKALSILVCCAIIAAAVFVPRVSNNCLDWVLVNRKNSDRMVWGVYLPTKQGHAWLKDAAGQCRDVMQPHGFECDDVRYVEQPYIDLHDEMVMAEIMKTRA